MAEYGKGKLDLAREPLPGDLPVDAREAADDDHLSEDEALIKQASDRMEAGWDYWRDTYELSKEDVRFAYEDQWPEDAKLSRRNRPMLTMNMLPQFAQQVVNGARRAKFAIQVKQISGKNDKMVDTTASGKQYSRAQVVEGLIRDIEDRSKAHDAYCNALQQVVEGGFAWLYVKTAPNTDDPFDIELRVEHIKHRYAAMIDPRAQMDDKSDAMWCSYSQDLEEGEFKVRYPDVPLHDMSPGIAGRPRQAEGVYFRGGGGTVRVVDYWWKQPKKRTAVEVVREQETVVDRLVLWEDEHGDALDELAEEGFEERARKEVDSHCVRYMRFVYGHILEGPFDWQSQHLPLVMVKGREVCLEDRDLTIGLFRYAHDAMRMLNYWMSAATEKVALVPRAPYIAAAQQIESHKDQWENMYKQNLPVLLYDALPDVPPPTRQPTTALAQGEMQLIATARSMLQDTVGVHDATLGRRTNEVSGVALQERQDRGEQGTFDFVDNLARAIVRVGEILVDMIPRCYTTDYVRRVVLPDDTEIYVDLNAEIEDRQTGRKIRIHSLDYARYACRIDVGPASKTQREEFVKMMIEWGRSDPQGFPLFRDLIVGSMDVPYARVLSQRMKAAVPRDMLSPQEQEQLGPPPPPSMAEKIGMAEAEAKMAQAEADKIKAQAEIAKAQAGVQSSTLRAQSDEARKQFEIEKGLNRQEEQAQAPEIDESKIEALVKRAVARALAERS